MPASSGRRIRALTAVMRGEQRVSAAARRALAVLLREAGRALAAAGYDTAVLDDRFPGWRAAVDKDLVPAIEEVFLAAWTATARGVIDPSKYATRHLEAVHNRLVGASDEVFDAIRLALEEGRQAQESIPQLAARVDDLLGDEDRWAGRARTIARTEVISANNTGARESAFATADVLGIPRGEVARGWLATLDGRTRESHLEADGQIVFGDQPYTVGGYDLMSPGDPSGPAEEVVNCRCAETFYMPGDPEYPTDGTASFTDGRRRGGDRTSTPDTSPLPSPVVPLPARTPVVEDHAVDPGPQSDMERMARALSIPELQMETRRGSAEAKRAARAELKRRGLTAAGTRPITEAEVLTGTVRVEDLVVVDPDGYTVPWTDYLAAALGDEETPVSEQMPEVLPEEVPLPEDAAPTHAGIAVQAADTGRVLMQQRALDPEDPPEVQGTWEFPGGGLEEGETPEAGAWREWVEETGLPVPEHEVTGGWASPDGVYQGYVATVATEATVGVLNPDDAAVLANPDDPERENPDVTAWFTIEQIQAMGAAVRPEVLASTDWTQFQDGPAPEEAPMSDPADDVLEAALAVVRQAGYALSLSEHAGMPDGPEGLDPEEADAPPVADGDPMPAEEPALGGPFYGIIWPEAVQSGDGRGIDAGATTWRDLPLPLMAQDAQLPGHDGAVRVGRIETMERDETTYAVPVIRYTGHWDVSPIALETARQVDAGVVRGISTDGDAVTVELRATSGATLDPMVDDFPEDGVVVEVATAARVSGGTVCSIPAFHQAYVANGDRAARTDPEPGWNEDGTPKDNVLPTPATDPLETPLVASAWSLVEAPRQIVQPAYAFQRPACLDTFDDGTPLTVTNEGHVFGHLAVWGTCHIGVDGLCQEPPASASNYAYYATGHVLTDDGNYVATGPLVMGTGHAALNLGHRAAAAHYDNTGTAVADVVMGQDHIGIWFSGMVSPDATPEQVYRLRASGKVSGDWRNIAGGLDLVAALVVNTPGFSIPRPALAASGGRAQAMVAAGMVQRAPAVPAPPMSEDDLVTRVVAALDRRAKAAASIERINHRLATARRDRAATMVARINGRV